VAEELAYGRSIGHSLPDLSTVDWIRIEPVPDRLALRLASDLGQGEREVLALLSHRPEATGILDDMAARRVAEHLGLSFTGTLGVLLRAKAAGHLESIAPVIDRFETLGFRLDPRTREAVLRLAEET